MVTLSIPVRSYACIQSGVADIGVLKSLFRIVFSAIYWRIMASRLYNSFVFFSAGPVGDHAILIDFASRFYESTGIRSKMLIKHPSPFLRDMLIPYKDCIDAIECEGFFGNVRLALFTLQSVYTKNCFVYVLPIVLPKYMRWFSYFIRFCTRSRAVGFNLRGGINFKEEGSCEILGASNYIDSNLDKELYYQQANRMLAWLGYAPVSRTPFLRHVDDSGALARHGLEGKRYIALHLAASHDDRSLPADRWNRIIKDLIQNIPDTYFVFNGAPKDMVFIHECLMGITSPSIVVMEEKVTTQELLTIYGKAFMCLTVHTGNAHLINMMHCKNVIVNIKGVYMFDFRFNTQAVSLHADEGCTCNPYERDCTEVMYKGKPYMACLFNISDKLIVDTVGRMYTTLP